MRAFLLISSLALAGQALGEPSDLDKAYEYLDALRKQAGMQAFNSNSLLSKAAGNHAGYLRSANKKIDHGIVDAHGEKKNRPGYTGATPAERAKQVGYLHSDITENVSGGHADSQASIDGLMSGIYHRFGFLGFDRDQVGVGSARLDERRHYYVYLMGSSVVGRLCEQTPQGALAAGGRYVMVCADAKKVRADALETAKSELAKSNPAWVVWPPRNAATIAPVFYEEDPDPLPDRSVSGYPISIQFNPALVRSVAVSRFKLYRYNGPPQDSPLDPSRWSEVSETRLLTQASDPNRQFSGHQFALFPLARLDWNTFYKAVVEAVVDGQRKTIDWVFKTRDLDLPMYVIQGQGEVLPVKPGVRYALYFPPSPALSNTLGSYQGEMRQGVQVSAETIDLNTLSLRMEGEVCETARFKLPGGKQFQVRLAAADNIDGRQPPETLYASCPEFAADFKISGQGEVLNVKPNRSPVTVYIQGEPVGAVQWRFSQQMDLKVEPWDAHALKIQLVSVQPGQQAFFTLSRGRKFTLQVQ